MNVSLTNELETFIDRLVSGGTYSSASEVVRDGLRLLKEQEELRAARLEILRADIHAAHRQSLASESRPLDPIAIKSEARRRRTAE